MISRLFTTIPSNNSLVAVNQTNAAQVNRCFPSPMAVSPMMFSAPVSKTVVLQQELATFDGFIFSRVVYMISTRSIRFDPYDRHDQE